MSRSKRSIPEINAGSMADIAFLLLIFFLVTTTMDTDKGIAIVLPPLTPPDQIEHTPEKERNVLEILINSNDHLLVEGKRMSITELTDLTTTFLTNNGRNPEYSDSPDKAIVSLKNDRGTSYGIYVKVQNELKRAYNQLRNEEANSKFGADYDDLPKAKQKEIAAIYPIKVSEAEPANVEGN